MFDVYNMCSYTIVISDIETKTITFQAAESKGTDLCRLICAFGVHISGIKNMSRVVIKPAFCKCENKDADQLRGNREADQRLCFRYIDSTIPLLSTYKISSL